MCLHAIGVYIHFLIIDGYNTLPSEGVIFLYDDSRNVQSICVYILLVSVAFMDQIYRNNHNGVSRLLTHVFSILLPVTLVIPYIIRFIINTLGNSIRLVTSFPTVMQTIEEAEHIVWILCSIFLLTSIIIPFFIFFKEEKYKNFVKYWGLVFFLDIGGIRLFLAILSYKLLFFLCSLIIVGIMIFSLYIAIKQRCPNCKKLSSMKYIDTSLLKEENISIKVENATRDSIGNLTGTIEQYIPGKREFFLETYQCKHCGYVHTKTVTKETASL